MDDMQVKSGLILIARAIADMKIFVNSADGGYWICPFCEKLDGDHAEDCDGRLIAEWLSIAEKEYYVTMWLSSISDFERKFYTALGLTEVKHD